MAQLARPTSLADLAEALQPFSGRRFVVKLGGEIMLNAAGLNALAHDLATLRDHGLHVVVVHGGGPQADALAARLGHTVRKVAGRRITDDEALEVAKMAYAGSINVELLAVLKRHGAQGVGLSGVDGDLITAERRPATLVYDPEVGKEEWVDFGHVGDVRSVDTSLLNLLLESGYLPVVASLGADEEGRLYNINADTVARVIAAALQASALLVLSNVPGILRDVADPESLVEICTLDEIEGMVNNGTISGGMLPKVHNCVEALRAGVESVRILDGSLDHSLLLESFTRRGIGTTLVAG